MQTPRTVVQRSVRWWLVAVGAGVAETLVRVALPDPPTAGQLAVRAGVYTVVVVLVASLLTGRTAVRWTVALLLGGLGPLSLVAEPIGWLWAGGSAAEFLADADGPTWALVGLRVAHLAAVLVALRTLFSAPASAFFRAGSTAVRR